MSLDVEQQSKRDKTVEKGVATTLEAMHPVRSVYDLLRSVHQPTGNVLHAVAFAIPPLRAGIIAIDTIIRAASYAYYQKKLTLSRAAKLGVGVASVGILVAATILPVLAGLLFVAAAGVGVAYEAFFLGKSIYRNWQMTRELRSVEREIQTLKAKPELNANDKIKLQDLRSKHRKIQPLVQKHQAKIKQRIFDTALAITAVVGLVLLLVPPLAPIGAGLLVLSAVVGITVKVGKLIANKLFKSKAAKKGKDTQVKSEVEESKDELNEAARLTPQPRPEVKLERSSTAKIEQVLDEHVCAEDSHTPGEVSGNTIQHTVERHDNFEPITQTKTLFSHQKVTEEEEGRRKVEGEGEQIAEDESDREGEGEASELGGRH